MPPDSRDLMSTKDSNYRTPSGTTDNINTYQQSVECNTNVVEDSNTDISNDPTTSTNSPLAEVGSLKYHAMHGLRLSSRSVSPSLVPKAVVPPGVTPQLINSFDMSDATLGRRAGNMGICHQSVFGHSLIAEAAKQRREFMAG